MTSGITTTVYPQVTIHEVVGPTSFEEMMAVVQKTCELPNPPMNTIWHVQYLAPGGSAISLEGQRKISEYVATHSEKRRGGVTVSVSAAPSAFGTSRMWQSHCESANVPFSMHVVRTMQEAFEIIGIDDPRPESADD